MKEYFLEDFINKKKDRHISGTSSDLKKIADGSL